MTQKEKLEAYELRQSGLSYKSIADKLGISVNTIASFCKSHKDTGIKPVEICPQCGAKFYSIPKRKKRKFCSDKCRVLWWNSHPEDVNRQAYYKAVCQYCGKEFVTYGNNHRKFCSRECTSESRKKSAVN